MKKDGMSKLLNNFSLISNLALLALVVYSVAHCMIISNLWGADLRGFAGFKTFSIDSNILLGISAWVMIMYNIKKIQSNTEIEIPKKVSVLKFIATVSVTITLLTVLFYLGPINGFDKALAGDNLFLHVINPSLAIFSFIFFESSETLKAPAALYGVIPVSIYGVVYAIMVLFLGVENGGWRDFYSLNRNENWILSFVVMGALTLIVSFLIFFIGKVLKIPKKCK